MAMPEFLNRLRLVSSMLPPDLLTPPAAAGERLRRKALDSAAVWLDPAFVAGVTPDEFFDLDRPGRDRLGALLAQFAEVAKAAGQEPTPDQRQRGLDTLVELVRMLRPVRGHDRELAAALWALEPKYPDLVLGFDCRFGPDSTGDPAVWIDAVIPDGTDVTSPAFDRFMDDVTRTARAWLDPAGLPHWPYPRLHTPADIRDEITEVAE